MFNIIICDDNDKDREIVETITTNFFDKYKLDYKVHSFNDYNNQFMKIIEENITYKIYLLDIETPSKSGIDIARRIRKNDVDSVIIFLTVHEELGNIVLKNDLMFLSFINKFDNLNTRLISCFKKSIQVLKYKQIIKFTDKNIVYTININDILYITKNSFERKTIIKTDYNEIKTNKSLTEVVKMLDGRFIQSHRACYINIDRKVSIDKTNKIIKFDNGDSIDLLSDKYRKELC